MKLVLNNESLFEQYKTEEEFLDSLASNMIPCLKLAKDKKLNVLTIYSVYGKFVYFGKTLGNILNTHPSKDAEIQRFKRLLHELAPDDEFCFSNDFFREVFDNGFSLLSFYPSGGKFEGCFYEAASVSNKIRNSCNRRQMVGHLIELKEIDFPKTQKYHYSIHPEGNEKHKGAHFHIFAGGNESTVKIEDFKSASDSPIHPELMDGVDLAKGRKDDLIELWNFYNSKLLYKSKE